MRKFIILSFLCLFMSNSIEAAHHESAKDEKIIFILDMEVIKGKENNVDSLISKLVKNVKSTEPGTIVYQYFKSQDNKISLYPCLFLMKKPLIYATFPATFVQQF